MTFLSAMINPFPLILNLSGTGLNDGDVYIGVAGQDPILFPVTVYWDAAATIPASQPLSTTGGYVYRNGTPTNVYVPSYYSVKVLDKNGAEVYYEATVQGTLVTGALSIESRAAGATISIPASVNVVETGGFYTYGDGGGAQYARGSGPIALNKFQSADGAFWTLAPENGTVNVRQVGAKGDGATDDLPSISLAVTILGSIGGGICFFPEGDYLVTNAIVAVSDITFMGSGYASRIKCPADGWVIPTTANAGIITARLPGAGIPPLIQNVRVTGLRIYGTRTNDPQCPKLIYFEHMQNLTIDHNYLENSGREGVWSGGETAGNESTGIIVTDNHVYQCGYPNPFTALPALQPNARDCVIANNILRDVGMGIGPSGERLVISGNQINGVQRIGIGTGDGGAPQESGVTIIIGNSIELSSTADPDLRVGIQLDGSGDEAARHTVNVVGNSIRILGNAAHQLVRAVNVGTVRYASVKSNVVDIDVAGVGFLFTGDTVGTTVHVDDNTVRVQNESTTALKCFGFQGVPNGAGKTLTVRSSDNLVAGMTTANSSYAYLYNASGGGTMDAVMAGDTMTGGYVVCETAYAAALLDNLPMFLNSDVTKNTSFSTLPKLDKGMTIVGVTFANVGTPANGTVYYVTDGTSGSNPLTGGGTGCLAVRQNGAWVAAT